MQVSIGTIQTKELAKSSSQATKVLKLKINIYAGFKNLYGVSFLIPI